MIVPNLDKLNSSDIRSIDVMFITNLNFITTLTIIEQAKDLNPSIKIIVAYNPEDLKDFKIALKLKTKLKNYINYGKKDFNNLFS